MVLYCIPDMPKSSTMPSILALPMLARSIWLIKYSKASMGTKRASTYMVSIYHFVSFVHIYIYMYMDAYLPKDLLPPVCRKIGIKVLIVRR